MADAISSDVAGEPIMPLYRIYWLGKDDHIDAADYIECESDTEAAVRGQELIGPHAAVELWLEKRYVATLPAKAADPLAVTG
jgi:hypothetical protein